MNNKQRQEYGRTLKVLMEDLPEVSFDTIMEACEVLGEVERKLSAIHERQCNGYSDGRGNWSEKAAEKDERADARLRAKLAETLKTLGLQARINGDPRGGAVQLLLPSGRTNNFGMETWGIYWV